MIKIVENMFSQHGDENIYHEDDFYQYKLDIS